MNRALYVAHDPPPPSLAPAPLVRARYLERADVPQPTQWAAPVSIATARAIRAARACALSAALREMGWTGGRLARVMGVAPSLVGKYTRGEVGFSDAQSRRFGSLAPVFARLLAAPAPEAGK